MLRDHHGRYRSWRRAKGYDDTRDNAILFNVAGDAEINDDVLAAGWVFPGLGANGKGEPISAKQFGGKDGDLAETYAELLDQKRKGQPDPKPAPKPGNGPQPTPGKDPQDAQAGAGQPNDPKPGREPAPGSAEAPAGDSGGPAPGCGGSCGCTGHNDWEAKLPADAPEGMDAAQGEIARMEAAAQIADHEKRNGKGSVPAGLSVWANSKLAPPTVDWKKRLRALVRNAVTMARGADDYTFTKLSRRSVVIAAKHGRGPVLPGMCSPQPRVTVVLDTSGSMLGGAMEKAMSEVLAVAKAMETPVMVLAVDAAVHAARKVGTMSDLKHVAVGGTDMREGIKKAAEHKGDVILVLTDGLTDWPRVQDMPRQRVVAAVVGNASVPDHLKRNLVRVKD